jgi:hypothetical protein
VISECWRWHLASYFDGLLDGLTVGFSAREGGIAFCRCRDFAVFVFHGLHVATDGDVLEVGVLEAGRVLEAVAEKAVEGDVGCPDEGDGCGERPVLDVAGEEEG